MIKKVPWKPLRCSACQGPKHCECAEQPLLGPHPCPAQTPALSRPSPVGPRPALGSAAAHVLSRHLCLSLVPCLSTLPLAAGHQPGSRSCDCHHPCPLRLGSPWAPALSCLGRPARVTALHPRRDILFDKAWNSQGEKYHILGNTPFYRVQC